MIPFLFNDDIIFTYNYVFYKIIILTMLYARNNKTRAGSPTNEKHRMRIVVFSLAIDCKFNKIRWKKKTIPENTKQKDKLQ